MSFLPKPTSPRAVPAIRAGAVAVTVDEANAFGDNRRLAAERVRFVELVNTAIRQFRYPAREAVDYVACRHAVEFTLLPRAGRRGGSALTYPNYRQWSAKLKGVAPEQRAAALLNRYAVGRRQRFGDDAFWRAAMGAYLSQNRLPATRAYKLAADKVRRADPHAQVPTYAQWLYRINQLDPRAVVLAREGEEALKAKYGSYIDRSWDDVAPGEVIVCDSRTFDTRVRVWDAAAGRWVAKRPTVAGMMDARSWYLVSYWITTASVNAELLTDTLGLYLYNNNNVPPVISYCDNGSDYCRRGFSTELEGQSIFKELGIKLVNAIPYNARAKTIERCFRDMMQQFDKSFRDYLGSRPGGRSQAADWYERHPEELPSEQEFCSAFAAWLVEMHQTPRNGKIHQGKSPEAIWSARPARPAIPAERLPFCFLFPVGSRTVRRGPAVELNRVAYFADCLAARIGSRVMVKIDRLDPCHVFCFDAGGRLLCEAKRRDAIPALGMDDPDVRRRIGEEMARQRSEIKQVYTMLAAETGGLHLVSPAEIFSAVEGDKLVAAGSMASVKGRSHKYVHHRLADPDAAAAPVIAPAAAAAPEPAEPDADDEFFDDPVDLTGFDMFMSSNTKREIDNEF
ncbi:MAG: transposase [Victivallaceae bacterium]|nr:transposase [Victivallaceae bacterium]